MAYRPDGEGQLFREDLGDFLRKRAAVIRERVDAIPAPRLADTPIDSWIEHIVAALELVPVGLRLDAAEASEPVETKVDISHDHRFGAHLFGERAVAPGLSVTFHIPFAGAGELLRFRPSSSYMSPMRAAIRDGEITMTYVEPASVFERSVPEIRREFDHESRLIAEVSANVDREVSTWNGALRGLVRTQLEGRLARLQTSSAAASAFGLPVRRRSDTPSTYTVPDIRKRVVLAPTSSGQPRRPAPEPALANEVYDDILRTCASMSKVIERSPRDFAGMAEETLRSHFLVALNAQFEGAATGETFNGAGKTDILIRHGDRNLFIAECKFWNGAKALSEAVNQLLSYATWRDGKLALLIFNRNANFSGVLGEISSVVRAHECYVRDAACSLETSFRAVLRHPSDRERELVLTALAFDVLPRAATAPAAAGAKK